MKNYIFENTTTRQLVRKFISSESGATAIEYAMIGSMISVIAVVALTSIGQKTNTGFQAIDSALP